MGWRPREAETVSGNDGVWSYDASTSAPGSFTSGYAPAYEPSYVNCITNALLALKPSGSTVPAFVQGASAVSSGGSYSTWDGTLPNPVTAGNCIVAFVWFGQAIGETITDSLGNVYTLVCGIETGHFTTFRGAVYVCANCLGGSATVTYTPNNAVNYASIVLHEYSGVVSVSPVDAYDIEESDLFAWTAANCAITTATPNCVLVTFQAEHVYFPPVVVPSGGNPLSPPFPTPAWLLINEPPTGSPPTGGGITNRTNYLFLGEGHQNNYTVQMRQRGQATIHLIIKGNDTYAPTRGSQVFLYDEIGDDYVLNFSGLIQNIENQFIADSGDHFVIINAVSFESVLDTVLTTIPIQFFQMTCGEIVKELFNTFEVGAPISLGNIEDGATIELLNTNFDTIASLFDELATSSNFIWGVNPATLQLYFQPPYTTTAPFVLTSPPPSAVGFGAQFGTINWKQIGNDYRNRQAVRINSNAFSHSTNYFQGAGQLNFTLSNPVAQVVNAWVTVSSPNFSVGTFTGNPSPGDTFTIEFPYGIPQTTWAPLTAYPIGAIIIDPGNFVQIVTVSEGSLKSGATEPVWNEVTGGTTTDGGLIWTCEGPQGLGTNTAFTYTFVEASDLDNTQFGQIAIGNTVAETVQNVQYALMAVTGDAVTYGEGINYSLPTWENGIVNTTVLSSTEFQCTSKTPGYSQGKCLFTTTSLVLSFNPTIAAGGSSPDEGLGNGQPGTITIAVGVLGTAIAAPGLAYQPGSANVSLATPLNSGSNLQVEYTRADGDTIQVENTTLVNELALITHGTGKYQAIVDYSDQLVTITAADALLQAQQILAAYSVVPQRVTFDTYQPGLSAGQVLTISVTLPTGAVTVINGVWVIEEIDAEIEPCELEGLCPGIGHYKYTVSCIDIQQIASYIDFWKQAGGGSSVSGSGSGTALVSTGGGSTAVPGTAIELEVNGTDTTDQTILNLTAGPGVTIVDEGGGEILVSATGGGTSTGISFAWDETPAGTIDGSNVTFTLANTPTPEASLQLFLNGVLQIQGTDYTIVGGTITFTTAPLTGAELTAFYRYGATSGTYVDDETPSGTVNGSNVTFTLVNAPVPSISLRLFLNGILQDQGVDYTLSGNTITFTTAPLTGAELIAYYVYAPSSTNFSDNETPSGTINSSNVTFNLANTPNPLTSLQLYLNGVLQLYGTDFTLLSSTITMTVAPFTGATLRAFYRY